MRNLFLALISVAAMSSPIQSAPALSYDNFKITDKVSAAMESETYRTCMKASGGVTVTIRNCGGAESQTLEKRHAASLKSTLARLSKPKALQLQADERKWQTTGTNQCVKQKSINEGGTLQLLEIDSCGRAELKRRITWLEQYK
jgi:uncharacterized protein YecT (DUF1311 family)